MGGFIKVFEAVFVIDLRKVLKQLSHKVVDLLKNGLYLLHINRGSKLFLLLLDHSPFSQN